MLKGNDMENVLLESALTMLKGNGVESFFTRSALTMLKGNDTDNDYMYQCPLTLLKGN